MIKGIGQALGGRIEPGRAQAVSDGKPVSRTEAVSRVRSADVEPSTIDTIVSAGPPIDAERVARIKAQIADGCYQIDPRQIAQKMIDLYLGAQD